MITDFGLKPGDLETICRLIAHEPLVTQALIFGSRAKGNYTPGSDVDIALKGPGLTAQTVTYISFQLNEETIMPYRFDVLNYHTLKEPALVEHINRAGIVIYEKVPESGSPLPD